MARYQKTSPVASTVAAALSRESHKKSVHLFQHGCSADRANLNQSYSVHSSRACTVDL